MAQAPAAAWRSEAVLWGGAVTPLTFSQLSRHALLTLCGSISRSLGAFELWLGRLLRPPLAATWRSPCAVQRRAGRRAKGWGVQGFVPCHFHASKVVSFLLGLQFRPQQRDS